MNSYEQLLWKKNKVGNEIDYLTTLRSQLISLRDSMNSSLQVLKQSYEVLAENYTVGRVPVDGGALEIITYLSGHEIKIEEAIGVVNTRLKEHNGLLSSVQNQINVKLKEEGDLDESNL